MLTTFHPSSTQRSTMVWNASNLWQMTIFHAGSCPCCDDSSGLSCVLVKLINYLRSLANPAAFQFLINALRKKPWIVYAKQSFGSPVHVLDYLGRYTHRVALSNDRILSAHNGKITFSYRDRKDQNRKKIMTLDAHEFIRRFLLHVIPKGFVRVRHFGFLANRSKALLAKCRQLLDLVPALPELPAKSVHELVLQLTGIDISRCPLCQKGTLVFFANLPLPAPWDSS